MKRIILSVLILFATIQCFPQVSEVPEESAMFEGEWIVTRQDCFNCPTTDTLRMEYAIVMYFPETCEFAISLPTDGCDGVYESKWFTGLGCRHRGIEYICRSCDAQLSIIDDNVFRVALSYLTQTGVITYSGVFSIEDDCD